MTRRSSQLGLISSETRERFLSALGAGMFRGAAARLAGLSPATVEEWMKRGRGQRPRTASAPYVEFVRAVELAEAQAYAQVSTNLFFRTRTDSRAAIAWLRTRYPHDWPRRADSTSKAAAEDPPESGASQRDDWVYLPMEAFDESIHQLLAAKRNARRLATAVPEQVPALKPYPLQRDSRIMKAGLVVDADDL